MLVVFIPTFDRVEECIGQIRALLNQREQHPIKIVVSDNGSSSKLQHFCSKNNIDYIAHLVNRGMDFNLKYFTKLNLNDDDWIWCLSDDDIVSKHAVSGIYGLISELHSDVAAVKTTHSGQFPAYKDKSISSLRQFKEVLKHYKSTDFIFYSTSLFKIGPLNRILKELNTVTNTYIDFSFIYLLLLKHNYRICLSSSVFVRHNIADSLSYNHVKVFNSNVNVYKHLQRLFPLEYEGILELICAVNLRSVIIFCLRSSRNRFKDFLAIRLNAFALFIKIGKF